MTTNLATDLMDTSDARESAVINNELLRLNVDIAALHETSISETGALRDKDYTNWCGKAADEAREHGVGFDVKISLLAKKGLRGFSPSILYLRWACHPPQFLCLHTLLHT